MPPSPRPDPAGGRPALAAVAALALSAPGSVAAAAELPAAPKAYLLLSAPGQARESLKGVVRGSVAARYVVTTDPGEALDVRLTAANPDVYFTLSTPGGSVILYDSSTPDAEHRVTRRLAPGNRYRLEVRLADHAARRKTVAPYTLSIARGGKLEEVR